MAAGLGFKDFVTGEVLTAADVDGYLMQGIWVFASAAARSAAVTSPQEGNYSYLKDTNSTEYYTGSAWVAAGASGASYAIFRDLKDSSTAGGTFTNGAWRTRDINDTQYNGITGASIASNQITLAAGSYFINVTAMAYEVAGNQVRLQNITDSTTTITGQSAYASGSSEGNLFGYFTITGTKVFEIQHRSQNTRAAIGFGVDNTFNENYYTIVSITKVA